MDEFGAEGVVSYCRGVSVFFLCVIVRHIERLNQLHRVCDQSSKHTGSFHFRSVRACDGRVCVVEGQASVGDFGGGNGGATLWSRVQA